MLKNILLSYFNAYYYHISMRLYKRTKHSLLDMSVLQSIQIMDSQCSVNFTFCEQQLIQSKIKKIRAYNFLVLFRISNASSVQLYHPLYTLRKSKVNNNIKRLEVSIGDGKLSYTDILNAS